jgi:glycosyltransferase involved in cell wall biosynthesis
VNVLLINFVMDPASPVLAWQLTVARELARFCNRVVVLTHRAAATDLPPNMKVVVFPNLIQRAPFRWAGGRWWINVMVFRLCRREAIDAVFIHMNMEWAYRLRPSFALLKLPVLLWYAHSSVTRRLRLALRCATRVVTSTPEGFRISSPKVKVIGQGIDTQAFSLPRLREPRADVITVSRLSRRKRIDRVIDAFERLVQLRPDVPFRLRIIGSALTADDHRYAERLRSDVAAKRLDDRVYFEGHVPSSAIPALYESAFVHVNVSETGSMDKTVLESLACGCAVLTSNEAFTDVFRSHERFLISDDRAEAIAAQVLNAYDRRDAEDREALRALVVGRHDVTSYARRVHGELAAMIGGPAPAIRPSAECL